MGRVAEQIGRLLGRRAAPHGRRFALVTITRKSGAEGHVHRDGLTHYRGFGDSFHLIDIRDYRASVNDAEVTIIDRMALTVATQLERIPFERLVRRLAGTPRLVFMTTDLHDWAIFQHLVDRKRLAGANLTPELNLTAPLFELFDRLDIRHLITSYDCPELAQIRAGRPSLATHVVDLHVDTAIFRDYGLPKDHDVIVYGNLMPAAYRFRHRVAGLLAASPFSVLTRGGWSWDYDPEWCGEGLARKINRCRLGLCTVSDFQYLVGRYFEIPACRTVVLGDMNEQGRRIFGDRYVHIDEAMSDERIVDTVATALGDPKRLSAYADEMYQVVHGGHSLAEHERKLVAIAEEISRT